MAAGPSSGKLSMSTMMRTKMHQNQEDPAKDREAEQMLLHPKNQTLCRNAIRAKEVYYQDLEHN